MRFCLLLALSVLAAGADRRNTDTPNTDTRATFVAPDSLDAWKARQQVLRRQILAAAGLWPAPPKHPLTVLFSGRVVRDGYTVEKVAIETLPGFWLGGNLYRPQSPGRHPAILHPHGHWPYGRLENSALCSTPLLAANFARNGFLVFAYDMVGYNDTVQAPHDFTGPEYQLWNFTPLGLQLWNSIRAADFLESLPDADPQRLAMTGASGGGTQTFLLAAVDSRIAAAAPVNMVSGLMQGGCVCENAPGLRIGTNNIEIAALFAPRPLLLVSATGDWTREVPQVEFPAMRKVWELYGKPELIEAVQFDAPHNYHKESREAVYEFFRKHLAPDRAPWRERNATVERLQDMLVFHGRRLPEGALSFEELFPQWKRMARAAARQMSAEEARERLRTAFHWQSRPRFADLPSKWFDGRAPAVLLLHPAGMAAAEQTEEFRALRAAGRAVLLLDAFQTGSAQAPRDRSHRHFLTFNLSDDAARVQDVAAAIEEIVRRTKQPAEVRATEKARWWALFGAAIAGAPARFEASADEFGEDEERLQREFFVPGLLHAGGAGSALRAAAAQAAQFRK
jgi:dienelactone hydrolase